MLLIKESFYGDCLPLSLMVNFTQDLPNRFYYKLVLKPYIGYSVLKKSNRKHIVLDFVIVSYLLNNF